MPKTLCFIDLTPTQQENFINTKPAKLSAEQTLKLSDFLREPLDNDSPWIGFKHTDWRTAQACEALSHFVKNNPTIPRYMLLNQQDDFIGVKIGLKNKRSSLVQKELTDTHNPLRHEYIWWFFTKTNHTSIWEFVENDLFDNGDMYVLK